MYYVTMTDTFMSGWGHSKGKINKLIFECKDYEEACTVEQNAHDRTDQIYINLCVRASKPYYNKDRYYPQYKTIEDYPTWYKKDRPFKRSA